MKCIADFVNADTEDLVFVQNATTGNFLFLNIRQYMEFISNYINIFSHL